MTADGRPGSGIGDPAGAPAAGTPILHLSADYPDPLVPAKTRAIANLLALAPDLDHRVFSLNRVGGRDAWKADIEMLAFSDAAGEAHHAVAYRAPPAGLLLTRYLDRLADRIAEQVTAAGFRPRVIHAHKLTIEGLMGLRLAKRLGASLVVSIQGNTDLKILAARPDLRPRFRRIWREASMVFPFAPWAARGVTRLLGDRGGPVIALPCPGAADSRLAPKVVGPLFRTAFHFRDAANKNAAGLIRAVARAARSVPQIRLDIVGGGNAAAFVDLARLARAVAPGRIAFLGSVPNPSIQPLFNDSCAVPLVSFRETFGMVFAEALLAGTPCLYARGRAIDGYFEEGSVVLAADPGDEVEIAESLARLAKEEAAFKARLAALAESGGLDVLTRQAIAGVYRGGLAAALGHGPA